VSAPVDVQQLHPTLRVNGMSDASIGWMHELLRPPSVGPSAWTSSAAIRRPRCTGLGGRSRTSTHRRRL